MGSSSEAINNGKWEVSEETFRRMPRNKFGNKVTCYASGHFKWSTGDDENYLARPRLIFSRRLFALQRSFPGVLFLAGPLFLHSFQTLLFFTSGFIFELVIAVNLLDNQMADYSFGGTDEENAELKKLNAEVVSKS